MTQQPMKNSTSKKTLVSLVGVATAAILYTFTPSFEGRVLGGYLDPVGIPTKCYGDTYNVIVGKAYTDAECKESLEKQLIAHAEPVLKCTPMIRNNIYFLAAAVDHAYQYGGPSYCGSSIAAEFNRGNFAVACKRFNENAEGKPQYIYVKQKFDKEANKWIYKTLPGLIRRSAARRELCEKGVLK